MGKIEVSIVIPSYNEEKYIRDCLESLLNSDYDTKRMEIIVVDGMSEDGTRKIVKDYNEKYKNIRLVNNHDRITPVALNMGISYAKGNYVMITGAHATFSVNYIRVLMEQLSKLDATGVGGKLITKTKGKTKIARAIVKILGNPAGVGNSRFRTGAGTPVLVDTVPFGIYKKEVFSKYGLYNEKLIRNHDIEWSKRIVNSGGKIYLISEVFSVYYARENLSDFAKNNYRNGYWNIVTLYVTKKFSSLSLRHYIPCIFICIQMSLLLFGIFYNKLFFMALVVVLGIYLFFISYASIRLKDKNTGFFYILGIILILHYSYGFGSLVGLFNIKKLLKNK